MHTETLNTSSASYGFYAVKVRTLAEETIAGKIRAKGFDVLAPAYVERKRYSDRMKQTSRSLFPGYIFVRMNAEELMPVVSTQGVSYIVKSGGTVAPLPAEEEQALTSLAKMETGCEPCELQPGQRVRIETGPLAGQQGVLIRAGDGKRVVISLNTIFQSVSVDVRDTRLKLLD